MKQDLYTIQEASVILGVSSKTLHRWEESGKITPIRTVGNQRRYRLSDIKKLEKRLMLRRGNRAHKRHVSQVLPAQSPVLPVQDTPVRIAGQEPAPSVQQPASNYSEFVKNQIPADKSFPQVLPQDLVRATQEVQPALKEKEHVQKPQELIPDFDDHRSGSPKHQIIYPVFGAVAVMVILFGALLLWKQLGFPGLHTQKIAVLIGSRVASKQAVLAANTYLPAYQLEMNVPTLLSKKVTFLSSADIKKGLTVTGQSVLSGGIKTNNANINAGKGKLTASNVLYSIVAGSNITISGDKQNPTISANPNGVTSLQGTTGAVSLTSGSGISLNGLAISNSGVLSVGGATGDVSLTAGSGISVSGTTITNSGVTSFQGDTGDVSLSAGSGISISGTTITNSDTGSSQNIFKNFTIGPTTFSAGSNNDTVTFASGSGIFLTGNSSSKTITITSNASGTLAGLNTNGVLYGIDSTHAGSTSEGATGTVLHGITGGAPVFSAVDLTSDVYSPNSGLQLL